MLLLLGNKCYYCQLELRQSMKKIIFTIITLTAVLLTAVFVFWNFFSKNQSQVDVSLLTSTSLSSSLKEDDQRKITGLIVPHFEPVSYLISDALKHVSTTPDLIILIGPNHFEKGSHPIITGIYSSPKLRVKPNFAKDEIQRLIKMGIAIEENMVISGDHSIGTPLSVLSQKFPNTKVLPIILKYQQNPENIQKLLSALEGFSSKNILIVASLDFSHYLSSEIAPEKDAQTEKYIENHDYGQIQNLKSDFLDSPWTLITFLKFLEKNGIQNGTQIAHTNTGELAGQVIESSTSFFTYIFAKD